MKRVSFSVEYAAFYFLSCIKTYSTFYVCCQFYLFQFAKLYKLLFSYLAHYIYTSNPVLEKSNNFSMRFCLRNILVVIFWYWLRFLYFVGILLALQKPPIWFITKKHFKIWLKTFSMKTRQTVAILNVSFKITLEMH